MVTFIGGGSLHSVTPAPMARAEPETTRIRSNPVPGHRRRMLNIGAARTHLSALHCYSLLF